MVHPITSKRIKDAFAAREQIAKDFALARARGERSDESRYHQADVHLDRMVKEALAQQL